MSGRDDRGSAAIWVLTCGGLLLAVATVALVQAAALVARHRAESAADLAALAGAAQIGVGGGRPCAAAARIAVRNRTRLVHCRPQVAADGRSGTVEVRVAATITLPVVGARQVSAGARAGRLPAAATTT